MLRVGGDLRGEGGIVEGVGGGRGVWVGTVCFIGSIEGSLRKLGLEEVNLRF